MLLKSSQHIIGIEKAVHNTWNLPILSNQKYPNFNFPEQYTINSSQDQFAFLFYNTEDRNGAEDEASNLHSSLSDIGFEATLTKWDNISSLPSIITGKLESLPSTASIVMICIMSHGRVGTLSDSRGSQIPLNFILHQLSQTIPNNIPLVSWPDIKSKKIII